MCLLFYTLQSLTGKYRCLKGNPCNKKKDDAMKTRVPCNENRVFPVGIGSQGAPCELYRIWVYSVVCGLVAAMLKGPANIRLRDPWELKIIATIHPTMSSNISWMNEVAYLLLQGIICQLGWNLANGELNLPTWLKYG